MERKSVLKIWHYIRQVAVYEKKIEMCTLLACTPLKTPANECKKSQFDVWQLKWHNRERERKKEFMNINQKMLQQQIIMQKEYDWHKIN